MTATVEEVVAKLEGPPVSLEVAASAESVSGVPASDGFYAWWVRGGVLPGVPPTAHPTDDSVDLLYVGISPARASSSQHIRGRLLTQHIGGNTSSSTFRFVLAALLFEELHLKPRRTATKIVLDQADNRRLRDWQHENLALTWAVRPRPWEIETSVIGAMKPPLNSATNHGHPFYTTVKARRAAFRGAAST